LLLIISYPCFVPRGLMNLCHEVLPQPYKPDLPPFSSQPMVPLIKTKVGKY
jgi:hypothetical protein